MRALFVRLKGWLMSLSFRTGVTVGAICLVCYALSFAQMLLPLPLGARAALWTIFFGLAKACQYAALLILGKAGLSRLRAAFRRKPGEDSK